MRVAEKVQRMTIEFRRDFDRRGEVDAELLREFDTLVHGRDAVVVGKREAEEKTVSVRRLGSQQQEVMTLDAATQMLSDEAVPPDLRGEPKREAA